jgi:hypothetical protein
VNQVPILGNVEARFIGELRESNYSILMLLEEFYDVLAQASFLLDFLLRPIQFT